MEKIAANSGWQVGPYAVMIAANLTYELDRISVVDLDLLANADPRMNVDCRLAMLAGLKAAEPGSVSMMVTTARARLSLTAPSWLRM
jgi:hypothetical protein